MFFFFFKVQCFTIDELEQLKGIDAHETIIGTGVLSVLTSKNVICSWFCCDRVDLSLNLDLFGKLDLLS